MIETDELSDTSRKWRGCFVQFQSKKRGRGVFHIQDMNTDSRFGRFAFTGPSYCENGGLEERSWLELFSPHVEVIGEIPNSRLFLSDGRLLRLDRLNRRQWRVGMSSENTAINSLFDRTAKFITGSGSQVNRWHLRTLWDAFYPTYYGTEAFKKVWEGENHALPYDANLAVGFSLKHDNPVLTLGERVIGRVVSKEGRVEVFEYADYLIPSLIKGGISV